MSWSFTALIILMVQVPYVLFMMIRHCVRTWAGNDKVQWFFLILTLIMTCILVTLLLHIF